jgi:hypothetical protein
VRQDDVIHEISGPEDQRSGTALRRNMSSINMEGDKPWEQA